MKKVNTVPEILSTFPDSHFDKQKWWDYAGAIHPELPKLCEGDTAKYEFEKDVLPVIETAIGKPERIRRLGSRFEQVVAGLQDRLSVLFDKECEVTVILYLGLCNAAGRVTFLGGEKVILLGVEKILELNWDSEEKLKALLYHEIGHIWHETYGKLEFPAYTQSRQSILQLWQEESTQDFFGDWCDFCGHSDVGYYLGCRFVRWMMKESDLWEIATMRYSELLEKYIRFAEEELPI